MMQRPSEHKDWHHGRISFDMIFGTAHEVPRKTSIWQGFELRWKENECDPVEPTASAGDCHSMESLSLNDEDQSRQKQESTLEVHLGAVGQKWNWSPSSLKRRAKVRFLISAAPTSTDQVSTANTGDNTITESITLSKIADICTDIQRNDMVANQAVGFIPCDEKPKGFDLYYHDSVPSSPNTSSLTLREALSGKDGLTDFGLRERLNIALTLSFSILQLCNTQWLGKVISLDDIVFLRAADAPQCYTQKFDFPAPFLVRRPRIARHKEEPYKAINFALFSLGVLLTHIIMGRPVEALDLSENMPKELLLSRKKLANEKVAICDEASDNYIGAVQWCFDHCFTFENLKDQDLSRNFHDAVIARLERDLRSIDCLRMQ